MELKEQNILFFTRTMKLGGTENVVLQLCDIFKDKVNKIIVCSCGGVNVDKLDAMGIKHYMIPDIENKSIGNIKKTLSVVNRIVREEDITIVHTHHRMAAFYSRILSLHKKCIFINTSHNTFYDKKTLTRLAYKKANLVACGEMVKKNLVDDFKLENVETITNSVYPFEEQVVLDGKIESYRQQGRFIVSNIGRLSEQKGMEYYLQAIPPVLKQCPNTQFLVIGEGEDRVKLEKLTYELGITDNVLFMGYRTDVQNLMKQSDLIVLSSLWEGYPLTPIEAFSVGKTIIATAVDGTVEIIDDNVNGYLVKARDYQEISDKIVYLQEHRDKLIEFEKEARRKYDEKLSFERFSQHYVDYYKEKINERT